MSTIRIDQNRSLIKEASPEKITGKWKDIVDGIIKTCKEHLGPHLISVYIGGSVAHGKAVENKSDVDSYIIVDLNKEEIEKHFDTWVENERKRMDSLFPFQRGVEIHLISVNKIGEGKKFQMKVFSTCVFGKDFNDELPEYKLDKDTFRCIRVNLGKDIEIAQKELRETSDTEEIKKISVWISKRLIRSAGMMCMWKGDFFTMDIPILTEMISSYYPDKTKEISKLFEYTKNPLSDKQKILDLLNSFGSWLVEEDKKIFNG